MSEKLPSERQERIQRFILDLADSDGTLIPVTPGVFVLRTTFAGPQTTMVDNCLTLFRHFSNKEQIVPFGWIGLRIAEENEKRKAYLVDRNLYQLVFTPSPSIDFDRNLRIARLKESGKWFFVGFPTDAFNTLKAVIKVDHDSRKQGWGKFLIQMAAQVAVAKEAYILACEESTHDITAALSRSGQSLYSRALGVEKQFSELGWYYQIGSQTPIDQVEFLFC